MSNNDTQWTAKGPALAVGLALLVLGLLASWRRAWIAAAVLGALGAGFVGYSMTIKDWCEMRGTTLGQSAWGQGWGGSFGECMRQKGWLSF